MSESKHLLPSKAVILSQQKVTLFLLLIAVTI